MAARTTQRKERMRQATLAEIRATARRLLVEHGSAAVTVNAVAREMGLSGPALYHYYAGHEELVGALVADFYRELAQAMAAARDARAGEPPAVRLLAACRAMRAWAVGHPAEFGWIFASPGPPRAERSADSPRHQAGLEFEQVVLEPFVELWETSPFPVPELDALDPSLREQLRAYSAGLGGRLPPEAAHTFLTCWIRLYGLLCMEVLHQLDFAFTDLEPVYEECLRELAAALGQEYRPPEPGR
ncbi:TetR/AcrR family transcriptional regulator [Allonocardiopsis opalescens]|uniref:TetR family transcriptional regulator n=1 Tax=Allonocardiopsis opalescens TaxID=1144618 RepID=A0A2T0Q1Z6_9ACTN|nr:WHG domain-containing protein [Allonocardiopsis opalescens]PRX97817.1 TetR family transcriptional regulator [Allonocardiopsis opalescens]